MNKVRKILKNKVVLTSIISIVALLIIVGVWYFIYDFLNDYRCSNMPVNEFFQDSKCEKYWEYK